MRLVVGRIGRAHGIRGEVAVDVRTDEPETRFAEGAVVLTEPAEVGPLTVTHARHHGGRLLVRFDAVTDRAAAERLRGVTLMVDSGELAPITDPHEFYDHELRGLLVTTVDGAEVGTIEDVVHNAQDLLVVRTATGAEVLIPFVRDLVPHVDPEAGRVRVDPPPGLLELAE